MANARGKTIDTTHLSADTAFERGIVHRDLISHCLRWTHVCRWMHQGNRYRDAVVLDVGCGVDLPLAKTLYTNRMAVKQYVGLDYNRPTKFKTEMFHTGKMPVRAFGGVDFSRDVTVRDDGYTIAGIEGVFELPTVITCFEVLEHVEPAHARRMLERMHELMETARAAGKDCTTFISTPCWDAQVGEADNHVSEIKRDALGAVIEDLGMKIVGNWGTFASQRDYKAELAKQYGDVGQIMFAKLSTYYDSNYVATLFAPLFPEHSRNNLWELKARDEGDIARRFPNLEDVPGPWTSSDLWLELRAEPEHHAEAQAAEVADGPQ